tara:strand:- start:769 stop:1146 length:378 start_codon:yes stop_codon:yes gene_type:complete
LFTAKVILLSKYFSRAKENKKRENIEISKEGINVNNEKKTIYFLLATEPLTLILFLIEIEISLNIIIKKTNNNTIFKYNKLFKFVSLSKIKLLSINVKKVINDTIKVKINTKIINMCLFKKLNIS